MRSILHRPVFMTIAAILGVWVAITWGVVQQSHGFARVPGWAYWVLYPSFVLTPLFFLFAAIADNDRIISAAEPGNEVRTDRLAASRDRLPVD